MKVVGNLVGCHSCAQLTAKVVESDAQMKLCTHTHNLPHTPSHFTHILSLHSSHHTPRTSPHTLTPHTHHRGSQKSPGGEGQDDGSSDCCHREGTDDCTKVSHLADLPQAGCSPYWTLFVTQALQGSGRICSRLQANWSKFSQSDDGTVPPEPHTLHCPIFRGQKVTGERGIQCKDCREKGQNCQIWSQVSVSWHLGNRERWEQKNAFLKETVFKLE